jgi:hypothetical protein
MATKPPRRAELIVFPSAPVLDDTAAIAPDGWSHEFGITQDEHPVEVVPMLATSCWRFQHGICQMAAT